METETLSLYYFKFFSDFSGIKEIDHIVPELFESMRMMNSDFTQNFGDDDWENELGVCKIEGSLGICFSVFDILYPMCRDLVFGLRDKAEITLADAEKLDMASKILICLNGESNTIFTQRKRLLDQGFLKNLKEELSFIATICLKFKKSSICWEYRRLVFSKHLDSIPQGDHGQIMRLYNDEREFLNDHIAKHPRNYYCWSHRQEVFKKIWERVEKKADFLESEIDFIRTFCEKKIHEYSAFHYLLYLLKRKQENSPKESLDFELSWAESLIITYEEIYTSGTKDPLNEVPYEKLEALKKFKAGLERMLEQQNGKPGTGSK